MMLPTEPRYFPHPYQAADPLDLAVCDACGAPADKAIHDPWFAARTDLWGGPCWWPGSPYAALPEFDGGGRGKTPGNSTRTGRGPVPPDPACTCETLGPHGHQPDCPSPEAAEWAAECAEFGCHDPGEDQPD